MTEPLKEGQTVPPVDPESVKRMWNLKPPWTLEAIQSACSPGTDWAAVSRRRNMIDRLKDFRLLEPWTHGEELDDAVFRIAATFPMQLHKHWNYKIPGDELFDFDPNAFVRCLVEETGIQHTWEPIRTKLGEGDRVFSSVDGGESADPDLRAKREVRQLLWMIWERFSPYPSPVKDRPEIGTALFADFMIDNLDLIRKAEDALKSEHMNDRMAQLFPVLEELEEKAQQSWYRGMNPSTQ